MSKSENMVVLIGHLGQDPEADEIPTTGDAVANLSIATSDSWRDDKGDLHESTEWHRVVAYKGYAKVARDYLRKGSRVYIKGKLRTRKWQDKQDVTHWTTEIIVQDLILLDRAPQNDRGADQAGQ